MADWIKGRDARLAGEAGKPWYMKENLTESDQREVLSELKKVEKLNCRKRIACLAARRASLRSQLAHLFERLCEELNDAANGFRIASA